MSVDPTNSPGRDDRCCGRRIEGGKSAHAIRYMEPHRSKRERDSAEGYEIELYRRPDGSEPVRRFIDSLSNDKRDAPLASLTHVLGRQGLNVCRSEWGKQLGRGLAEFRLRHDKREILARHGARAHSELPDPSPEKILLRVFFDAHGNRLVLLLSGYDKGSRPSTRQLQREIEQARTHLKEWQAMQTHQRRTRK